jgi:hypothetical protein
MTYPYDSKPLPQVDEDPDWGDILGILHLECDLVHKWLAAAIDATHVAGYSPGSQGQNFMTIPVYPREMELVKDRLRYVARTLRLLRDVARTKEEEARS